MYLLGKYSLDNPETLHGASTMWRSSQVALTPDVDRLEDNQFIARRFFDCLGASHLLVHQYAGERTLADCGAEVAAEGALGGG